MKNEQLKIENEERGFDNLVIGLSRLKTASGGDRSGFAEQIENSLEPKDASILFQELAKIENPNLLEQISFDIYCSWDAIFDDIDCLLTEEECENDEDVVFTDKEISKRTLAYYLDDVKKAIESYYCPHNPAYYEN